MKTLKVVALATVVGLAGVSAIWAQGDHEDGVKTTRLLMPIMNADRGMELFASKGCATCHSVNDVGGEDASPLDAHKMDEYMNPFDHAAKMWLMAPYMIAAQEDELGEQILFTGDELSNIIAFLHDDAQQLLFTEEYLESIAGEETDG
ncbi:MAG: c-type cytochrome [Rhodobacteraceae bacterium]|nr:c-type cytochrome [Paracoccaceae bacterium]